MTHIFGEELTGILPLFAIGVFILGMGGFALFRSYNKIAGSMLVLIGGGILLIALFLIQS